MVGQSFSLKFSTLYETFTLQDLLSVYQDEDITRTSIGPWLNPKTKDIRMIEIFVIERQGQFTYAYQVRYHKNFITNMCKPKWLLDTHNEAYYEALSECYARLGGLRKSNRQMVLLNCLEGNLAASFNLTDY